MKAQWLFGAIVLAVLAVVAGVWASGGTADPVFTRDRLAKSGDLAVTFQAEGYSEGYVFTRFKNGDWIWDRTEGGRVLEDTVVSRAGQTLVRLAEGCWAELPAVRLPFIPGVTVARELKEIAGRRHMPDGSYVYDVSPGETVGADLGATEAIRVEASEDLREVESAGSYGVHTSGTSHALTYGTYRVSRLSGGAREAARVRLDGAVASPVARFDIRFKLLDNEVIRSLTGPYAVLVAEACPGNPGQLYPASAGGQRPGARSRPLDFVVTAGSAATVPGARPLTASINAPAAALAFAADQVAARDVPIRPGGVFVVVATNGSRMAVLVTACSPQSFFGC